MYLPTRSEVLSRQDSVGLFLVVSDRDTQAENPGRLSAPWGGGLSPHGRVCSQAEHPKVLSAAEDRMDELGASIAQARRTVALIKVSLVDSGGLLLAV